MWCERTGRWPLYDKEEEEGRVGVIGNHFVLFCLFVGNSSILKVMTCSIPNSWKYNFRARFSSESYTIGPNWHYFYDPKSEVVELLSEKAPPKLNCGLFKSNKTLSNHQKVDYFWHFLTSTENQLVDHFHTLGPCHPYAYLSYATIKSGGDLANFCCGATFVQLLLEIRN